MVGRASVAANLAMPAFIMLLMVTGCVRAKPVRTAFRPIFAAQGTLTPASVATQVPAPVAEDLPVTPSPVAQEPQPAATATNSPPSAGDAVASTATPAFEDTPTYVVRTGDTLVSIAERFQVSAAAIARVNSLTDADALRVGQTLIIPLGEEPLAAPTSVIEHYVVKSGDTLSQIARAYQTTPSAILAENPALQDPQNLAVGTVLRITKGNVAPPRLHVVQRGESLASIARANGVSLRALAQANALADPNRLIVGQVLVIPY